MSIIPEKKSIGLLLDPDKAKDESLESILRIASECKPDIILTGGSLSSGDIEHL
jgi:heptaprenylglyceryl phosphate synthase